MEGDEGLLRGDAGSGARFGSFEAAGGSPTRTGSTTRLCWSRNSQLAHSGAEGARVDPKEARSTVLPLDDTSDFAQHGLDVLTLHLFESSKRG